MKIGYHTFFLCVVMVFLVVGLTGCAVQNKTTVNTPVNTTAPTVATEDALTTGPAAVDAAATTSAPIVDTDGDVTVTTQVAPTASVKEFTMTAKNWEFTPSTITVNKGDRVRLKITSVDVDHGFAIAAFNVNQKLTPGKTEIIEFTADKSGSYTFFCSVLCGGGHRDMKGTLIVK